MHKLLNLAFCVYLETLSDGLSIEDVRRGLSDADAAVNCFTVTSRFEIIQRSLTNPSKVVALRLATKCTVDSKGRVRYEAVGDELREAIEPSVSAIAVRAVFDGQLARFVRGTPEKDEMARISRNRASIPWRMDPSNFIRHFLNKPVEEQVGRLGGKVLGEKKWDGHKVLVIETEPVTREQVRRKLQFLVDCLRNFTVVRKAAMVNYSSDEGNWHDYTLIEGREYEEVDSGIWLPREVNHESFKVIEGKESELSWRCTIHNDRWSVNDAVPDSLFTMPFPEGVYVTDEVSGREYRNTRVTDQTISDAANSAKELQQMYSDMPSPDEILRGTRWHWWLSLLLVTSGMLVLAGLLFFLLHWQKNYTK